MSCAQISKAVTKSCLHIIYATDTHTYQITVLPAVCRNFEFKCKNACVRWADKSPFGKLLAEKEIREIYHFTMSTFSNKLLQALILLKYYLLRFQQTFLHCILYQFNFFSI